MRLAWFSPLPPARTGVAGYSADVVPRLDASGLAIDRFEERNAHDFVSAQTLLLQPSGPMGTGKVVLCAHDPLTGVDNRSVVVDRKHPAAPKSAVGQWDRPELPGDQLSVGLRGQRVGRHRPMPS